MSQLRLSVAQTIVAATLKQARDRGFLPLGVVVLDARGAMVAYAAEDGTSLRRADIALAKANGALAMGLGSRTLATRAKTQPAFYAALPEVIRGGLAPAPGGRAGAHGRRGSGRRGGRLGRHLRQRRGRRPGRHRRRRPGGRPGRIGRRSPLQSTPLFREHP